MAFQGLRQTGRFVLGGRSCPLLVKFWQRKCQRSGLIGPDLYLIGNPMHAGGFALVGVVSFAREFACCVVCARLLVRGHARCNRTNAVLFKLRDLPAMRQLHSDAWPLMVVARVATLKRSLQHGEKLNSYEFAMILIIRLLPPAALRRTMRIPRSRRRGSARLNLLPSC